MPIVCDNILQPVMSFYGLYSLTNMFGRDKVGFRAEPAGRRDVALQKLAYYFLDKVTAENLVIIDPNISLPDHGVEFLVKAFEGEEKCGAMAALTFYWPSGIPNIQRQTGKEKRGKYSFPIYGPMMDEVGRWAVKHQEQEKAKSVLLYPPHVIDVPCFSGGMFVTSREILSKMDGLYFHERGGGHMHSFCKQMRQLGYSVKAAMHIICAGGGTNHINFLENYGSPVKEE